MHTHIYIHTHTQIIASATGSDDVHSVLADFLGSDQYFRLNPIIAENIGIDTKVPRPLYTYHIHDTHQTRHTRYTALHHHTNAS